MLTHLSLSSMTEFSTTWTTTVRSLLPYHAELGKMKYKCQRLQLLQQLTQNRSVVPTDQDLSSLLELSPTAEDRALDYGGEQKKDPLPHV